MDDAKYPAFDTKPYRIVKSRSEASVPVNVAPTYYIVASDLQGFPLQQAIPLVQMSTNAQLAPRPPENQLPPLPVPRPGTPMRWYIASLLRCLGVPARLSGFNYLVETLLLLVNRPFETRLVTGEVYPVVAKQCNTTPIGVDQAIRTAQPDVAGTEHTCVLRVDGAESRAARAAPDELRVSGECADVCEDSDGGVPLLIGN